MSTQSTGMIPFSLAETLLLPDRKVRTLLLGRTRFLMWTPRFFKRTNLRVNLISLLRVGLFDTQTSALVKELRSMERPVKISGWNVFNLYSFGDQAPDAAARANTAN